MGFLSKYDSSAANTNLTVNINSGKYLKVTYQYNTGRSSYNINSSADSNIYYIKGAFSQKKVIIKIEKQNYPQLMYVIMNATGSSYSSAAPSPNKIWEKDGYIYLQYNKLTLSSSQSLAIFYLDHMTAGSSNSQSYNYGVNIIEAIITPKWTATNPKIYDDGTEKTILPTIDLNNYCNGNGFSVGTNLTQARFWEVSPGKTYKIRCNANTTAEAGNSNLRASSSRDISTDTTAYVTTTKTTDSQTGETLYTFTAPSGYPLISFVLTSTGTATVTYSMETINPRLEGQRTAGWYDVDDYGFSTVWESTGY